FAGPEYRSGSSITASALSSDTSQLRAGSGVKGVPRQRGVISTLDAADGSPEWNSGTKSSAVDWTSSLGRIFRADLSTKARLLESRWTKVRPPVIYAVFTTMILNSNSPPGARRQGAQSVCRWTGVHHPTTRATLHANQLRVAFLVAQHPVQSHCQLARDGHLGQAGTTAELQTMVSAMQLRVESCRRLGRFHQQPAHHHIALLADSTQALTTTAGVLAWIQTQITHHLFAPREALYGTERQHEGQAHHRTHAGMGHQQLHFLASLGLSGHCLIQLGDCGIQRSQQLSQI